MNLHKLMAAIVAGCLLTTLTLSVLYFTAIRRIARLETEAGDGLPPNVPGRFVQVRSHRVHVIERGEGPAILLVPGTGGTTLDWETSVLDDLARDHRVVALDLFGMGFSERDDAFAYGVTLWADQLVGTLDALGLDRVSVIGQSLGGAIALVFAGTYPSRVNRTVSVDSGPWMPPFMLLMVTPGIGETILARSEYWPERPDQPALYAARLREVYRIRGTRRNLLRAIPGEFFRDGLTYFRAVSRVQCPTLLVHGAADDIIPVRAAASLRRLVKGSAMVVLDGAGHFSMQDSPRRFLQEVRRFLDAPSAEPRADQR
jgi:pimeloyl-ACP methyl ester carboxylesterase